MKDLPSCITTDIERLLNSEASKGPVGVEVKMGSWVPARPVNDLSFFKKFRQGGYGFLTYLAVTGAGLLGTPKVIPRVEVGGIKTPKIDVPASFPGFAGLARRKLSPTYAEQRAQELESRSSSDPDVLWRTFISLTAEFNQVDEMMKDDMRKDDLGALQGMYYEDPQELMKILRDRIDAFLADDRPEEQQKGLVLGPRVEALAICVDQRLPFTTCVQQQLGATIPPQYEDLFRKDPLPLSGNASMRRLSV